MFFSRQWQQTCIFLAGLLTISSTITLRDQAVAQSPSSQCQPPQTGEYIILVVTETQADQAQIRQTLPAGTNLALCQYRENVVTRIGGFDNLEDANRWGQYINDIVTLPTVIVRPPSAKPTPTPSPNYPAYNPKPLGSGFAVLIDYYNNPDVAQQIKQLLGKEVGLISYRSRPYLLASHTKTQKEADTLLTILGNRGFWSIVVDSSQVVVLTPIVRY